MRSKTRIVSAIVLAVALALVASASSLAQSTTKQLSTNFTLVNLGSAAANGTITYYKPDGSVWGTEPLTNIPGNGGQAIFRQYDPPGSSGNPNLTSGSGSVMVTADQPLGAVVQILARGQNPTSSGAYAGLSAGDSSFFVPLVAKQLTTATGIGNSQIIVQNTGSAAVTANFTLNGAGGPYTFSSPSIAPGASYTCDLAPGSNPPCGAAVPTNWFGSAVVTSTGTIAVVSNFFTGDALQTFNAFSSTAPKTKWFVPLFTSRLPNSLSSPITVQNVSGSTIPADGIQVACTPDAGATGFTPFTKSNTSPVPNNESFIVNPVTDTSISEGFFGSCVITAPANVVAFVQLRFVATGEAAAYEAIPDGGTDTKVIIPLIAKRLPNGFATAVTIQNLSNSPANVTLTYTPSSGSPPIAPISATIPANGSLIQNHRITAGTGAVPQLPDGWVGTLTVSSNTPINAFVQLTFLNSINPNLPGGDNFMAHNAFTQP